MSLLHLLCIKYYNSHSHRVQKKLHQHLSALKKEEKKIYMISEENQHEPNTVESEIKINYELHETIQKQ